MNPTDSIQKKIFWRVLLYSLGIILIFGALTTIYTIYDIQRGAENHRNFDIDSYVRMRISRGDSPELIEHDLRQLGIYDNTARIAIQIYSKYYYNITDYKNVDKSDKIRETRINKTESAEEQLDTIEALDEHEISGCENYFKDVEWPTAQIKPRTLPKISYCPNKQMELLYFYSPTCPYCDAFGEIISKIVNRFAGLIRFRKICIQIHENDDLRCRKIVGDKEYLDGEVLRKDFGVRGTPSILINRRFLREGTAALSHGKDYEEAEVIKLLCAVFKNKPIVCSNIPDVAPGKRGEKKRMRVSILEDYRSCPAGRKLNITLWVDPKDAYVNKFLQVFLGVNEGFKHHLDINIYPYPLPRHKGNKIPSYAILCMNKIDKSYTLGFLQCLMKGYFDKNMTMSDMDIIEKCLDPGINLSIFEACLGSEETHEELEAMIDSAKQLDILSLPVLVINCNYLSRGIYTEDYLKALFCHMLREQADNIVACQNIDTSLLYFTRKSGRFYIIPGKIGCSESDKIKLQVFLNFRCYYCKKEISQLKRFLMAYKTIVEPEIYVISDAPVEDIYSKMFLCAGADNIYQQLEIMEFIYTNFYGRESINITEFIDFLKEINGNTENFRKCMENNKITRYIEQNTTLARSLRIQGTPTFIFDCNKMISGYQSYDSLVLAIEDLENREDR